MNAHVIAWLHFALTPSVIDDRVALSLCDAARALALEYIFLSRRQSVTGEPPRR